MQKIEANDAGFTNTWSSSIKFDCGTLYSNPHLSDDLFFNKLTQVACIDKNMIEKSIEHFKKNNLVPYVYSTSYPELELLLEKMGFFYHDTQHVLKKRNRLTTKTSAIKITTDTMDTWTRIFCESYDCPSWSKTVSNILKKSLSSVDYFIDPSYSSCMALYEKYNILGLYCLGTVPSKRNKGAAVSLVDFASDQVVSRNLEFLMLETYERDNLLEFYSKLGFDNLYSKKVYSI